MGPWAKTIKKNTNSTQNKSETHRAKQYEVTSFLSTDCKLSTETCSKNVYSLCPQLKRMWTRTWFSRKFSPIMYADDTTLLSTLQNFKSNHSSNSLSYNSNAELTKITQWLAVNRLSLNAKKTKMMIFHSKQNKLSVNKIPIIKINGMPIERVTEFKFLGVLIDSNLTWSPHCNYIANKLSRICGVVSG